VNELVTQTIPNELMLLQNIPTRRWG